MDGEHTELDREDKQHMEAVLYAFACKFLEKKDLDEIKEVLSMTVLGEMIWKDGLEKGMETGEVIKLIAMICRKMQKGKNPAQIAEDLDEELSEVERICEAAEKCAPEYDCDKIYSLLKSATV